MLWRELAAAVLVLVRGSLIFGILFYRSILSVHMGGVCRFSPSCSEYAHQALLEHAPHRALFLIVMRLLKCRPGGPYGFDPVPRSEHPSRQCHCSSHIAGAKS